MSQEIKSLKEFIDFIDFDNVNECSKYKDKMTLYRGQETSYEKSSIK